LHIPVGSQVDIPNVAQLRRLAYAVAQVVADLEAGLEFLQRLRVTAGVLVEETNAVDCDRLFLTVAEVAGDQDTVLEVL